MDLFNDKEMELLKIAGVNIENKVEYTDNEKNNTYQKRLFQASQRR